MQETFPLTGLQVASTEDFATHLVGIFYQVNYEAGGSIIYYDGDKHTFNSDGGGTIGDTTVTTQEMQALRCLIRSLLWRQARSKPDQPLAALSREMRTAIEETTGDNPFHNTVLLDFDSLLTQSQNLTFHSKCLETLCNIVEHYVKEKQLPTLAYVNQSGTSAIVPNENAPTDEGITFAAEGKEAVLIYRWLFEEGYLASRELRPGDNKLELTGKAFLKYDEVSRGKSGGVKKGFLVTQYDNPNREYIRQLLSDVSEATQSKISPVWEEEHLERIDERIFRLIKEANAIVVDVTGERFNVGLELGYAMGLGKQIVLIAQDGTFNENVLPFDIRTLNCLFYSQDPNPSERAEMMKRLTARVQSALDLAELGMGRIL